MSQIDEATRDESSLPKPGSRGSHPPSSIRRLLASAFILWQLGATAVWLLPPSALQQRLVPMVRRYMVFTGSAQNWHMFAPNPANVDEYLTTVVTYRDGTRKTWMFPRMHDLGYLQRYQKERFRKMFEYAHKDAHKELWPSLARYAALEANLDPATNPVAAVALVRHWQSVPPPGVPLPPYKPFLFYRTEFARGSVIP